MSKDIFLIDFDITISLNDSTDVLLEKYNVTKKEEIIALYRKGELTIREYIKYGLESLNVSKEEYVETLKQNVKVDKTFQYFLDEGFDYRIVSAGADVNVLASLQGNNIHIQESKIISNELIFEQFAELFSCDVQIKNGLISKVFIILLKTNVFMKCYFMY